MASVRILRWLPALVAGAVLVAWLEVAADAVHRTGWSGVSRPAHFAAALLLFTSMAVLVSLAVGLSLHGYEVLERRLSRRWPAVTRWLAPAFGAALTMAATAGTAFWTFSGERIRGTPTAQWGPWALIAALGVLGGGGAVALRALRRLAEAGTGHSIFALAVVLGGVSAVLSRVDLNFYVSLYARLHTLLEVGAVGASALGLVLLLIALSSRHSSVERTTRRFSVVTGVLALAFVLVEPLRGWVDEALRHAWREPVYVGRMLSRMQIAEGFIRDPRGWRGATMSSVAKLRERYDIATTTRSPIWDESLSEPPWLSQRLALLRGNRERNVIVFYVDTLRADVARDVRVMPNTVRFAAESLDFRRAYTTGSDTLHALPGITGGSYDLFAQQPNDLLRVSRSAAYRSVLFVAQSAHEFLTKLLPQFKLDDTVEVPDYAPGNENVWGYGADQPTAGRLVDRSLDWLRDHRDERFLLWLFNYDVHNWRELDEAYARQAGKKYQLLDESDPVWRYRVAAHEVDVQFGRLLEGLRDLGVADDTVLLFVSDHGEGLGREGFWVHSVFLWEALIHVPLMLRVPGVPPAVVNDVVSLVDVAPTLSRCMVSGAESLGYQGEDLLSNLVPGHPPRRLPLVLMSTLKEVPVRLGIIDPASPWKLVLPLEGAVPELYDLRTGDPDALDVSLGHRPEMLRLLNDLVRTPLFPRRSEAGVHGPLDQAAVDGRTAIAIEAAQAEAEKATAAAREELEKAAEAARAAKATPAASASGAPSRE